MFGHKLDLQRQEMTHLTEIIALLRFTPRTKPHIIIFSISPPAHCPLILTQTGFTDIWIHWQILDIFKDNCFQLCLYCPLHAFSKDRRWNGWHFNDISIIIMVQFLLDELMFPVQASASSTNQSIVQVCPTRQLRNWDGKAQDTSGTNFTMDS